MRATWKAHEKHGRLTKQSDLPDSVYAFPKERKEPLTDARHVRNAAARFDQVTGVTAAERDLAFANIKKAAKHYDVDLSESSAKDFGVRPQTGREKSAAKSAAMRKRTGTAKKAAKKAVATKQRSGAKKTAKKSAATSARKKTRKKKMT